MYAIFWTREMYTMFSDRVVVVITFTPSSEHIAARTLDLNCGTLCVRTVVSMQKLLIQCSRKIVSIVIAGVFVVSMTIVNFEKRAVSTTKH